MLLSFWVAAVHSSSQMIFVQSCCCQLEVSSIAAELPAQKANSDLQHKALGKFILEAV